MRGNARFDRSTANRRAIEPRVATHRLLQGVSRVIAPEDFRNDGVETPDQNLFTMRKNHSGPTLSVPENEFLADPVDRPQSISLSRLGGALVELTGIEPVTSCLQSRRSPS